MAACGTACTDGTGGGSSVTQACTCEIECASTVDGSVTASAAAVADALSTVGADAFHPGFTRTAAALTHVVHQYNASWRRWCAAAAASAALSDMPLTPEGDIAVAHLVDDAGPARLQYVHHPKGARAPALVTHCAIHRIPIAVCTARGVAWHGEVDLKLRTPFLANNAICTAADCSGNGTRCGDITITGYVPYFRPALGSTATLAAQYGARPMLYAAHAVAPRGVSRRGVDAAWVAYLETVLRKVWSRQVLRAMYPGETKLQPVQSRMNAAGAGAGVGAPLAAEAPGSVCSSAQGHDGAALAWPAGAARGKTCGAFYPLLCNAPCMTNGDTGYIFDLPAGGLCCPVPPRDGGAGCTASQGAIQALHPAFLVDQLASNGPDKSMVPGVSPVCATGLGNVAADNRGTPFGNARSVSCIASPQFACSDQFKALGVPPQSRLQAAWDGRLAPMEGQAAAWNQSSTAGVVQWCLAGSSALPTATGTAAYQPQATPLTRTGEEATSGPLMTTPLPFDSPLILTAANAALRKKFEAAFIPSADRTVTTSACGTAVGRTSLITCPGDAAFITLTGAYVSALSGTGKPVEPGDPAWTDCTLSIDCVAKVGMLIGHDPCRSPAQQLDNPSPGTLWGTAPFLQISFTADVAGRVYYRTSFKTDERQISFGDMSVIVLGTTAAIVQPTMTLALLSGGANPLVPVAVPAGKTCTPDACLQFSMAPVSGAQATKRDQLWENIKTRFISACGATEARIQLGSMATGTSGESVDTAIVQAAHLALHGATGMATNVYVSPTPRT